MKGYSTIIAPPNENILNNILKDYVTNNSLISQLNNYVTSSSLTSKLNNYSTIANTPVIGIADTDLNNTIKSGFYRINAGHSNCPSGVDYGQLLVIQGAGDTCVQLAFNYSSSAFYQRSGNTINNTNGSWKSWRAVSYS